MTPPSKNAPIKFFLRRGLETVVCHGSVEPLYRLYTCVAHQGLFRTRGEVIRSSLLSVTGESNFSLKQIGSEIMRTIKFKISVFNSTFMETTILKKLESLDDFFDMKLSRDTQELSLSPRQHQRLTANHIDREIAFDIEHPLTYPKA